MGTITSLPRDAWRLARPYFSSEERWSAWAKLGTIIALTLSLVGVDVLMSFWQRAFYNTLQQKDYAGFLDLLLFWHRTPNGFLPGFASIAALAIAVAVFNRYMNQWLQISWRQWMTTRLLQDWLADRAYYRISLITAGGANDGTDNPDQRISEDLRDYIDQTLTLGLDLMSNIVSLFSFVTILWTLSGPLAVFGVTIPGYLVWVALLYAALGTALTHLIGRPFVGLRFRQQRVEADFRFSLARLRENVEAVALSGGEEQERRGLAQQFVALRQNWWDIMQRAKLLNAFVNGYSQVSSIFPFLVAAPRYFTGALELGGLTQTVGAFSSVQGSMSWLVTSYASLANLRAIVDRLTTFQAAIAAARHAERDGVHTVPGEHDRYTLEQATLRLPDGRVLLENGAIAFTPGVSAVISGASGGGKSTMFRALAGIWPFGSGRVSPGRGTRMFLPQRPYFPLGPLREALAYPQDPSQFNDAELTSALLDVGLPALVTRLDELDNWSQSLSGGEQQRLAVARALIMRPDWLFLDEATASLDPAAEQALLAAVKKRLPDTTVISIAHREAVAALHDTHYVLERGAGGPGRIVQVKARAEAAPQGIGGA